MRDIKFRVWDKQCRLYLTLAGADWGGEKDRGTFCNFKYIHLFPPEGVPMINPSPHYGGCLSFKLTDDIDDNRLVFEQYTGLKDENNTEIYEGDVVKYDGLIYSIKYQLSRFMLCAPRKMSICLSELMYDCDTNRLNCEIIGNIHVNSELLEEK